MNDFAKDMLYFGECCAALFRTGSTDNQPKEQPCADNKTNAK